MAKSTFVTAPSFASSSSVTSINHVPRVPVPSWNTPILAYTRDPSYRSPPYFPPPPRVPFPFYQFLPFFFDPLLYTPPARALAHIIPEVHSSDKNEISRATLSVLRYLRNVFECFDYFP